MRSAVEAIDLVKGQDLPSRHGSSRAHAPLAIRCVGFRMWSGSRAPKRGTRIGVCRLPTRIMLKLRGRDGYNHVLAEADSPTSSRQVRLPGQTTPSGLLWRAAQIRMLRLKHAWR